MLNPPAPVLFDEELTLEIVLWGSEPEGEFILLIVKCDAQPVFVGLIDCYTNTSKHEALEYLKALGKDKFDFVCWTHPHDDHSVGMVDVCNCCYPINNKNKTIDSQRPTDIIVPQSVIEAPRLYDFMSENVKFTVTHFRENMKDVRKRRMNLRAVSGYSTLYTQEFIGDSGRQKYVLCIESFSPAPNLCFHEALGEHRPNFNFFSVGLVISIANFRILLAADIEDGALSVMDAHFLKHGYHYVKIPHHASSNTIELAKLLRTKSREVLQVATSTVYRKGNLPHLPVLDEYASWNNDAKIFITSSPHKRSAAGTYGCILTRFFINKHEQNPEFHLEGQACCYGK